MSKEYLGDSVYVEQREMLKQLAETVAYLGTNHGHGWANTPRNACMVCSSLSVAHKILKDASHE